MGHEERFPSPSLSGRCRLGEATFAGMGGKEEDAPFAAIRRISSIATRLGLSLLPSAAGPGSAACHGVFLRGSPARRGSGEPRSTATLIPPYPVDIRAGNVRNDQG
jgi:hypothetical protein